MLYISKSANGNLRAFVLQADPERTSLPRLAASLLPISQSAIEGGRHEPISSQDFTDYDKSLSSNCAGEVTA